MEYVRGKNLKQFIEDFKNKGQLIEEKIINLTSLIKGI